jgi:hypothetical protein
MSRPKSEITGLKPYSISARLTEDQRIMFVRLRGTKWLRAVLQAEIDKNATLTKDVALDKPGH